MFGNAKTTEETKKPAATPSAGAINALVKGTLIEGNVRCESDLRIDGAIKGKLLCQAKVIIGPTGSVEGEIRCQNAVIEGKFQGILVVSELLNIRETAEIDGDITTGKLLVQSGAKFNVTCKMDLGASNGSAKGADLKNNNHGANATTETIAGGKAEVRN
ncbi:MAG: polymer-forming cytoskeletal protein [Bacteroidetes bacterium]|nr:polymer-forming cytoskeletal protein [Bacteroidota bacterium]